VARGIVAVGPVALGVVAVGPLAIGMAAAGQAAAGVVLGVGQLAAGLGAIGQVALGGVRALGEVAAGRSAAGVIAWSGAAARALVIATWLVAALAVAWSWWRAGRPLRRLAGRGTSISLVKPGTTCLRGRIVALRTLVAPLSRVACIGYDLRRIADRGATSELLCEDFFVEDGTGRARVLAADTRLVLEPLQHLGAAVEGRSVANVNVVGGTRSGADGPSGATAVERVLLPGDEVVVAGQAICHLDAGPAQVNVAVHGGAGGPVLVTNRDLDELRAEAQLGLWLAVPLGLAALMTSVLL
jgi:hypothetical protein